MVWKVRRVVTGHDAQGRSTFIYDDLASNVKEMESMPGLALTDLWETVTAPADNGGHDDAAARPVRLEPPQTGSVFRIVEFPPDSHWSSGDGVEAFGSVGAAHASARDSNDPMRHKTSTIDYIVVLKGEMYAIMDTGETLLRAGDVFVQRGTMHSWSVRSNEPCIIAAVLVSAFPHP